MPNRLQHPLKILQYKFCFRYLLYLTTDSKDKDFCSYEMITIDELGCALTSIQVQVEWDEKDKHFSELWEFGCLYKDKEDKLGLPWRNNGAWQLFPWKTPGLR